MTENTQEEINHQTQVVGAAFKALINKRFGALIPPEAVVTPIGIEPIDALLGGGIVSSAPVMLSSTPETGKTTVAHQFSKSFQSYYNDNGIIVYIDAESAGSATDTHYRQSRITSMELDETTFNYCPMTCDIGQVFEIVRSLCELKKQCEDKTKRTFNVMVVWDSVASTRCDKVDEVEDHNKIIGLKARQLGFYLDRHLPDFKFNQVTFVIIDQIRADIKIASGPAMYAPTEKSVGNFNNMKSATNIYSLQHATQQWVFLSKKKDVTSADGYPDIDGWFMEILTEKNKLAPSKHAITAVFDKNRGIDRFWTCYTFLSDLTPTENKIKKKVKSFEPNVPLMITNSGAYQVFKVSDPNNPSNTYTSKKFYKRTAKDLYNSDETFRQWFDYAVGLSVEERIVRGMFKFDMELVTPIEEQSTEEEFIMPESNDVESQLTPDVQQYHTEPQENHQYVPDPIAPNSNTVVEQPQYTEPIEQQYEQPPVTAESIQQIEEPVQESTDLNDNQDGYQSVFSDAG